MTTPTSSPSLISPRRASEDQTSGERSTTASTPAMPSPMVTGPTTVARLGQVPTNVPQNTAKAVPATVPPSPSPKSAHEVFPWQHVLVGLGFVAMFLLAIYVASQRRQPPAVPTLMPSTVHYHIEAPQQLAATESARQALPIAVQRPLETPIEPPAATPYVAWGNANSTPATAPSSSLATQHNQDSSLVMDAPRVAQRTDRAVASPWSQPAHGSVTQPGSDSSMPNLDFQRDQSQPTSADVPSAQDSPTPAPIALQPTPASTTANGDGDVFGGPLEPPTSATGYPTTGFPELQNSNATIQRPTTSVDAARLQGGIQEFSR